MKKLILKAWTILKIIKNILFPKDKYDIHFISEDYYGVKTWYYVWKNWPWNKTALMMVDGADEMCEKLSKDGIHCDISIRTSKYADLSIGLNGYTQYERQPLPDGDIIDKYLSGAYYKSWNGKEQFWIYPVTLAVLGRYPKYIYIKN